MTSSEIKSIVHEEGADLCGIGSVSRFAQAPKGFHPTDIYRECQSVIVFAKRVPTGPMHAVSCIPYTIVNHLMAEEVDRLTLKLSLIFEDIGIPNVSVPTDDPYEHWLPEKSYGRAILSLRHAAHLAGLGVLGKNTLLINDLYGNMLQLGALLVSIELKSDPIATYQGCLPDCRLCLDICPQYALDGTTVNQALCRPLSNFVNEKGYTVKKCYLCRKVCPHYNGIKS